MWQNIENMNHRNWCHFSASGLTAPLCQVFTRCRGCRTFWLLTTTQSNDGSQSCRGIALSDCFWSCPWPLGPDFQEEVELTGWLVLSWSVGGESVAWTFSLALSVSAGSSRFCLSWAGRRYSTELFPCSVCEGTVKTFDDDSLFGGDTWWTLVVDDGVGMVVTSGMLRRSRTEYDLALSVSCAVRFTGHEARGGKRVSEPLDAAAGLFDGGANCTSLREVLDGRDCDFESRPLGRDSYRDWKVIPLRSRDVDPLLLRCLFFAFDFDLHFSIYRSVFDRCNQVGVEPSLRVSLGSVRGSFVRSVLLLIKPWNVLCLMTMYLSSLSLMERLKISGSELETEFLALGLICTRATSTG